MDLSITSLHPMFDQCSAGQVRKRVILKGATWCKIANCKKLRGNFCGKMMILDRLSNVTKHMSCSEHVRSTYIEKVAHPWESMIGLVLVLALHICS